MFVSSYEMWVHDMFGHIRSDQSDIVKNSKVKEVFHIL